MSRRRGRSRMRRERDVRLRKCADGRCRLRMHAELVFECATGRGNGLTLNRGGTMRKLALAIVLLSSCGDDAAPTGPLSPLPPPGGQQLTTMQYTVQPGAEKYFCYTFHSPKDGTRAITEVQPIEGSITHHIVLF